MADGSTLIIPPRSGEGDRPKGGGGGPPRTPPVGIAPSVTAQARRAHRSDRKQSPDTLDGGGTFDPDAARAQFPILSRTVNGKPLVYLDSAASAQKPQVVIDALTASMEHSYANVHRGLHTLANDTTEAFEQARETVARFLNAESPDQIVWTKGGTEAFNLVAAGLGQSLQPGDEIITTQMEHHANIVPWAMLRDRLGIVLRWAPVLDDGSLDMGALADLIGPRTKLVAVTHMSNVLGTVNDVRAIADLAHAAGAQIIVDGCQGAVHCSPDVQALDCDFYVFTGHKLYGPTGIGGLYGKRAALEALPPYQGGGEMIATVTEEEVTYAGIPHRFEAGTPPILEVIGLGAALEWFMAFDRHAVAAHERALYDHTFDRLSGMDGLRIIGEAPGKGAILTFTLEGTHAHDVAQILDRYGVAVRAGVHCAEPLSRRFGITSSARASFALYNTVEDADAFVDALIKAREFFL